MEPYGIIYKATNNLVYMSEMSYIGQTTDNLIGRKKDHKRSKIGDFCKAIQDYGFDNFRWEIIKVCYSMQELNIEEPKVIEQYNTLFPFGYNLKPGGDNHKHHEETKRKLSEDRKKEGGYFFGKHHTKETKRKISEANKGKKRSEEIKQKMSRDRLGEKNNMYGKKHSKETCNKMRNVHADVSGMKNPMFNKHHTIETKRKISETKKNKKYNIYNLVDLL